MAATEAELITSRNLCKSGAATRTMFFLFTQRARLMWRWCGDHVACLVTWDADKQYNRPFPSYLVPLFHDRAKPTYENEFDST